MRPPLLRILISLTSLLYAMPMLTAQLPHRQALVQWSWQELGDSLWHPCSVPSTIQQELIKLGKLPNPYYRDNERVVQWVSERDWLYRTNIQLSQQELEGKHYVLQLEGIDTYADVFLSGEKILSSENMFVGHRLDITDKLTAGDNLLVIHLKSPLRMAHGAYLSAGFNYPADNDHAEIRYSPFTRKAPYSYGWDWGMRLVTMGIWQPVHLIAYGRASLEDTQHTLSIDWDEKQQAREAHLQVTAQTQTYTQTAEALVLSAKLLDAQGHLINSAQAKAGELLNLRLKNPKLWWPRGWGKPYLYTLSIELRDKAGKLLDTYSYPVGIREIKFINRPDTHGTSFYFEVNKQAIFIRGANYVPSDHILTNRTSQSLQQLFDDIEFANMNMIRIWGGGVYENKAFYDEADKRGILLWQDFMFACTAYPSDQAFLQNVQAEAIYQLRRLRKHSSIALWCGNNEVAEALKYWGWQKKYSAKLYQAMNEGHTLLFDKLLRELSSQYAPDVAYISTSPMEANWGRASTWGHGDAHYWGLWYGREPFDIFEQRPLRFVSEFGFQAFPTMQTIRRFALPEDYALESDVMRLHQKASTGNERITEYMQRAYPVPQDFSEFVYVSQVLQARGMEQAIRILRRQKPINMGLLYWQLNDSWPTVSWSSLDYYTNYKGLHYTARRAYAPLTLGTERVETDSLAIYTLNDLLRDFPSGMLTVSTYAFGDKKARRSQQWETSKIMSNASTKLLTLSLKDWLRDSTNEMLIIELKPQGAEPIRIEYYNAPPRELKLPAPKLSYRLRHVRAGHMELELRAETLVKDLMIELELNGVRYSDNLFDLYPGESKTISLTHPQIAEHLPLRLYSLGTLGRTL